MSALAEPANHGTWYESISVCDPVGRGAFDGQNKVEMAFRRVTYARRIVACQRERVEMLARNGHDTTSAERILDLFARTLDIFEDGLRRILGQDSKPNRSRQAITRACSFKRNTFNIVVRNV